MSRDVKDLPVAREGRGRVGVLRLQRPERLNAVNLELYRCLVAHLRALKLDEVRLAAVLRGSRGRPGANGDGLAEVIVGVAECALANPQIAELEVNPVFAYPDRAAPARLAFGDD